MNTLSFKNRISLYYMAISAILIAFTFITIYYVVKISITKNIDKNLEEKAKNISQNIKIDTGVDQIKLDDFTLKNNEYRQPNPIFVQIVDNNGKTITKSPNLHENELHFVEVTHNEEHLNKTLNKMAIRQIEIPIENNDSLKGFVICATSLETSKMSLENLKRVLFILFFIKLGLYYLSSKYLAGKSIRPIQTLLSKIKLINENSLYKRVQLPHNQDELYELSKSFNRLLNRLENSFTREKQLTSEVSHELRTPLSTIQGTLEVLIRKPRTEQEYQEKIKECLIEIKRANEKMDRLIILTRLGLENASEYPAKSPIDKIVHDSIVQHSSFLDEKEISLSINNKTTQEHLISSHYAPFILDNFLSNAIKYSKQNGQIDIFIGEKNGRPFLSVKDYGLGIREVDLQNLFKPFFRSNDIDQDSIKGAGLGLSIAKKASNLLKATITVDSQFNKCTIFTVQF